MFNSKSSRTDTSGRDKRIAFSLVIGVAAAALSFGGFNTPALAAADSDPNLVKLEMKFFQHDFGKDDDLNSRLERLEKMVFGQVRTGDSDERLKNLVVAVPNLSSVAPSRSGSAEPPATASNERDDNDNNGAPPRSPRKAVAAPEEHEPIANSSQYPAVTAIERRLLGRDFVSEPIGQRLARLETKTFGKPSTNDDLSDRVDRLKERTGVDVAKTPPPNSDWADDEDRPMNGGGSVTYYPPTTPYTDGYSRGGTYGAGGGGSRGGYSGGGGSYGMGGGGSRRTASDDGYRAGGGYGYGGGGPSGGGSRQIASAGNPVGDGYPQPAPDAVRRAGDTATGASAPAMGLNETIAALENELFGKVFHGETIPGRLNRLEATVFPNQKPSNDMAMPDRVRRLTDAVPISDSQSRRIASRGGANPGGARPSYNTDAGQPDASDPAMPPTAPQRTGGGLSRIIKGMGNLIGGGGYNAYPVGSNLVQDPQTGLLWDRFTGNLIDPATGMVVGNRVSGGTMGGAGMSNLGVGGIGMGAAPMGGYGGFNNGLSPIGTPYGMGGGSGSGMRFGFGGGGIRFGGGGPGMWP